MYKFGKTSSERLDTCDERLQWVMKEAISTSPIDFSIITGHRDKEEQDKVFSEKKSKAPWPTSKHNSLPSLAVDICPMVNGRMVWGDISLFDRLAEHILATATRLGITLRWGGDFNMDGPKTTSDAWDKPHFEIKENKK